MDFKKHIVEMLSKVGVKNATELLEVPPDPKLGNYALPCFSLAKEMKKAPGQIAEELAGKISKDDVISEVKAIGPYVNFFIRPEALVVSTIRSIEDGSIWGARKRGKRITIESPGPNTNKPLHLGHVRNMVLGSAVALILEKDGNEVIKVNINNDRGVHICKSMLAYQRWGDGKQPDKKPDHFVGDFYVKYQKEAAKDASLEYDIKDMLKKWEEGDPEVKKLWEMMNGWAFQGFKETYERYRVKIDKEYYESETYLRGKEIVKQHKDILVEDDNGNLVVPLEKLGLQDKVVLRADGTSVYMTQDLALTMQRIEDYHPDLQIWVVASEQNLHFKQLFAILKLFGVEDEEFYHLSYGMVYLPDGRMKSREGKVVDADDLLTEMENLAFKQIKERQTDWKDDKIREKAKTVALGAIRFFNIKYDPSKDFIFDPENSLSFEGDTGPYLQYTHARICSILRKGSAELDKQSDKVLSLLTSEEELELVRQLGRLTGAFRTAADQFKPSTIAVQLLEIGRAFNTFYHACPVLKADEDLKAARLHLIDATRRVLDEGLSLLGIESPDEM